MSKEADADLEITECVTITDRPRKSASSHRDLARYQLWEASAGRSKARRPACFPSNRAQDTNRQADLGLAAEIGVPIMGLTLFLSCYSYCSYCGVGGWSALRTESLTARALRAGRRPDRSVQRTWHRFWVHPRLHQRLFVYRLQWHPVPAISNAGRKTKLLKAIFILLNRHTHVFTNTPDQSSVRAACGQRQ